MLDTGDGPRALPPVEIVPLSGVYDYAARYTAGETEFFCPARLDGAATEAAAGRPRSPCTRALGLAQISRADLILDADGTVWFLEANVAPGMTETSLLPLARGRGRARARRGSAGTWRSTPARHARS